MARQNKEFISLKEASEISGYSPDYVGQLIRSGKLPGKQVFQQIVWMTTENDLRAYMEAKKSGAGDRPQASGFLERYTRSWRRELEAPRLAIHVLYLSICLALVLFLLLFYIFSSSLEHRLDRNALERFEAEKSI